MASNEIHFGLSLLSIASLLAVGTALATDEPPPTPAPKYSVRLEKSVMVPMRDGVHLSTDLYFPEGAGDRLPVILVRTPYNKKTWRHDDLAVHTPSYLWPARLFASQGYVVAVQDVRGKFESEGQYLYAGGDARDGFDTTQWMATQPWSSGKVGTYGCSYLGEVQYQQATQRNPHLTAMIPQSAGPMQYRAGGGITGGALELSSLVGWERTNGSKLYYRPPEGTPREVFLESAEYFRPEPVVPDIDYAKIWSSLPIIDMMKKAGAPPTDWNDIVSRDFSDPWWDKTDYIKDTDRFDVPTLHINGWNDYGVAETLHLFVLMSTNAESARGRENQFAIISPTTHCKSELSTAHTMVGQRDLGDARLKYYEIYLRWFDYWLKGTDNSVLKMPKLQIYVMGKNQWHGENEWPLRRTRFTNFYLHSGGGANSRFGDGVLSLSPPLSEKPDEYIYDPKTPVPTTGGALCVACSRSADLVDGALDQSEVETRHDVLVYTSEPLKEGLEVTGPLDLVLYVSSSAPDTDFVAKLVDVYPNGTAYNLQEGILRARYREGFERKVWMKPEEVYEIHINLRATSNYFLPNHRVRLEVTSSSFPRFDRNLNTGGRNYDETTWAIARNSVQHSDAHPSHLVLPVIP